MLLFQYGGGILNFFFNKSKDDIIFSRIVIFVFRCTIWRLKCVELFLLGLPLNFLFRNRKKIPRQPDIIRHFLAVNLFLPLWLNRRKDVQVIEQWNLFTLLFFLLNQIVLLLLKHCGSCNFNRWSREPFVTLSFYDFYFCF